MFEMILSSFIVGFLVAIPPGTVTIAASQKSILYGFKNSIFFTCGSCISDIFYILIVFFGVAPLFDSSNLFKIVFWYLSSILLFYFGYDAFKTIKNRLDFTNTKISQKTLFKDILSGVLITLTNPMTIAGWFVIAGGFFTHWNMEWPPIRQYGILSITFIMAGVLCWFIPLLFLISKAKRFLNNNTIKGLIILSGIFFIAVGIFSIFSATKLLMIIRI